jgi:predicted Zn-dependent protease
LFPAPQPSSIIALIIAGAFPLFAAGNHPAINLYSIPQEIALGRQMSAEVETQAHVVSDPAVAEYINRLGQNLAAHAGAEFPITVRLIESDEIDAFTLPGGFIYVNTSLVKMADNEAELASVIAHEIGHAAARHATRQASRGELAKIASLPLLMIPGWRGVASMQAARLAGPVVSFRFSRAFEAEADRLSVHYLAEAGYDPNASVDMFERIESTERRTPGAVSRLFLSHPPTRDRILKTQKEIGALASGGDSVLNAFILNTSEFEDIRKRLLSN